MAEKNLEGLDASVINHLLRHRTLKQDQVDRFIATLPDDAAHAIESSVSFDAAVAKSRAQQ